MIQGYFGLPGAGKTSFLAKTAQKELKRIKKKKSPYKRVFTNFDCSGCWKLEFKDLGKYEFKNCLILIDEITLEADSRDFKNFGRQLVEFFVYHRHYKCDVIYFCQQYDRLDKTIRDLTAELWYVKKIAWWTVATRIYRVLDVDEVSHEIVTGYRFPCIWEKLASYICPPLFPIRKWCFRPFYYKYFDSWYCPQLAHKEFERW